MTAGRISVVIPVFNTEAFLGEAIESVLAQAEQPLEIIVVDDGSTDSSAEIAESFGHPVRVIRQTNAGHVAARNRGLETARGQYVVSLDADDLFSPDKFALQTARLDRHPDIDLVIGQIRHMRTRDSDEVQDIDEQFADHISLQFGAFMIRRELFERVGFPDETMRFGDDWDWLTRVRELSVPILLHRHVVLHYRLHEANMTRDQGAVTRSVFEAMRRSLARRRKFGDAVSSLPPLSTFFEAEGESE